MFPLGRFFTVWVVIWHICLSSTSNAHVTEHQDAMPTCEGSMTCHDEEVDGGFDSALASKVGFKLYTPVCPDPAMPTATTGASVESGTQTIAIPPTRAVHVTHIMILTSDVPEPVTTNASVKATPAPTPRVTVQLPKRKTVSISPGEGYIRPLTRRQDATISVRLPDWGVVEQ